MIRLAAMLALVLLASILLLLLWLPVALTVRIKLRTWRLKC